MSGSDWMTFYYAHPAPMRMVGEVRRLVAAGEFEKPEQVIVIATFLSQVMASNASHIEGWLSELDDLQGASRKALHAAAWLSNTPEARDYLVRSGADAEFTTSAPNLLERAADDPTALDAFWAYYFATGDPRAVRRVVSALEHISDFGAAARFREGKQTTQNRTSALHDALFQSASWSLTSLMQQHPPLQSVCEGMLAAGDLTPNERCGLALALEKVNPQRWRVQIDPASGTARIFRQG